MIFILYLHQKMSLNNRKLTRQETLAQIYGDEESGDVSLDEIDELEEDDEIDSGDEHIDETSNLPATYDSSYFKFS